MFSPPPSSAPSPSVRLGHKISITTIHVMALDGIVNVNSLFTFAIFLGLAWYPIPTLIDPSSPASCAAGSNIAENLISCHVYSFSSFLFSSLIALAIKQAIKISKDSNDLAAHGVGASLVDVNLMALRVGMLVSSFGSVLGCGFLMMALVALVQIKLGTLGCGSIYTFAAIGPLGDKFLRSRCASKRTMPAYGHDAWVTWHETNQMVMGYDITIAGVEWHALTEHLAPCRKRP
ncbi:hypothetical protein PVK06_023284 [Gossypium arboreum]|uniref:Uncharacterized protein n=1 Tax=Gossypium arboreum TaxID=29729 RepID=A0ABR0PAR3_GOSAR|nr:hypothetical protein PVK06_023284 [Gossypium arboreum]